MKEAKQHKGYWLRVFLEDGNIHDVSGIKSYSEALYLMNRRYSLTPNVKKVFMFVGTQKIGEYSPKEGTHTMGRLTEVQNAGMSPFDINYPKASDDDKETLNTFDIPFRIVAASQRTTTFTGPDGAEVIYLDYKVEVDATSADFKYAENKKQFNHLKMTITLPKDDQRSRDFDVIQQDYVGKDVLCKLAGFPSRNGRVYYKVVDA